MLRCFEQHSENDTTTIASLSRGELLHSTITESRSVMSHCFAEHKMLRQTKRVRERGEQQDRKIGKCVNVVTEVIIRL